MRLIELPLVWTVALDVLAWLVIHLGVAWVMARQPAEHFDPRRGLCRIRDIEADGRFYERRVRIKAWKPHLPDAAGLFGRHGFPKTRLERRDPDYLRRFAVETCRAEWSHWIVCLFAPFFFLWNKPAVGWLMIGYILIENLPFIAVQRYNRARLLRALDAEPNRDGG